MGPGQKGGTERITMRGTKEFHELMDKFEKDARDLFYGHTVERDKGENLPASVFYTDGFLNTIFHAYVMGYQLRKSISQLEAS